MSVSVWPTALSGRLRIEALVGRYPTNELIRRELLHRREDSEEFPRFNNKSPCGAAALCGISSRFRLLSPTRGQITHVLLTRAPLYSGAEAPFRVRLACLRHAASVDSEPGSNSRLYLLA